MLIRPETNAEFPIIYELVEEAFKTAKVSDGDEQEFVNQLRASANYIPELALVAEDNGQLVGHIMFTKTTVREASKPVNSLLLAPLSVVLGYRNQGLGSLLVKEGFKRAKALGYTTVFLVGDPGYYQRFGFKAIDSFAIRTSLDIPPQYVQACELVPNALQGVGGIVDII